MKKKLFIITGAPGTGKTSILRELFSLGFKTGDEYARNIIREQQKIGGDILPWKNIKAFQNEVLSRRIQFYESIGDSELAFVDRGIPDQLAFAKYRGFSPAILQEKLEKYKYANKVFITHPWKEIYSKDQIRKELFEEVERMHETICKVYCDLGYSLVSVPKVQPDERAKFIIDNIEEKHSLKY